jgi:hypothetical protein
VKKKYFKAFKYSWFNQFPETSTWSLESNADYNKTSVTRASALMKPWPNRHRNKTTQKGRRFNQVAPFPEGTRNSTSELPNSTSRPRTCRESDSRGARWRLPLCNATALRVGHGREVEKLKEERDGCLREGTGSARPTPQSAAGPPARSGRRSGLGRRLPPWEMRGERGLSVCVGPDYLGKRKTQVSSSSWWTDGRSRSMGARHWSCAHRPFAFRCLVFSASVWNKSVKEVSGATSIIRLLISPLFFSWIYLLLPLIRKSIG